MRRSVNLFHVSMNKYLFIPRRRGGMKYESYLRDAIVGEYGGRIRAGFIGGESDHECQLNRLFDGPG